MDDPQQVPAPLSPLMGNRGPVGSVLDQIIPAVLPLVMGAASAMTAPPASGRWNAAGRGLLGTVQGWSMQQPRELTPRDRDLQAHADFLDQQRTDLIRAQRNRDAYADTLADPADKAKFLTDPKGFNKSYLAKQNRPGMEQILVNHGYFKPEELAPLSDEEVVRAGHTFAKAEAQAKTRKEDKPQLALDTQEVTNPDGTKSFKRMIVNLTTGEMTPLGNAAPKGLPDVTATAALENLVKLRKQYEFDPSVASSGMTFDQYVEKTLHISADDLRKRARGTLAAPAESTGAAKVLTDADALRFLQENGGDRAKAEAAAKAAGYAF